MLRFAFLVELPDGEREEYTTAGEGLTAKKAVERAYDTLPDGTEIITPLRGGVPDSLDLSPPESKDGDDSDGDDE